MEKLSAYVLSVTCAALILGILKGILNDKSGASALLRMLGGLFLTLAIISPITKFDLSNLTNFAGDLSDAGQNAAAEGEQIGKAEYRSIIKASTEAYILDKAQTYQAELAVEVSLCDDTAVPVHARLQGDISPYGKNQMQQMMEDDLGIAKENQLWIG